MHAGDDESLDSSSSLLPKTRMEPDYVSVNS